MRAPPRHRRPGRAPGSKGPIRVMLVDDHTLLRAGLRALLEDLEGVEVVAEAGDGREALDLMRARQPDIVLMDIAMPGMNGLEATARAGAQMRGVQVIILSMHASEEYVVQALRAGAAGYLLKDAAAAELELALRTVARGAIYLTGAVSRQVLAGGRLREAEDPGHRALLTPRQREILQLIAEGQPTKGIARLLGISVKTVETHRAQLMERLDIHDIPGLVRHAMRAGLVPRE